MCRQEHTPGPYHIAAITRGRIVGDESAKAEKYQLCSQNATVATIYRPKDCPLLKAAPDLLAVCEEIAEHGTDDWEARMHTLRAAIAKAHGEKGGAA